MLRLKIFEIHISTTKKNIYDDMDSTKTVTHISLCAGYGGIDLGLKRAIPNLRTIAFSEIEAFACANLVAKMEAGLLDPAPIWTDLKTFPWSEFRDRVDILSGGYPCQPFSAAGKRLGTEDPRHLWPFIANGIVAMRPRMCFFENVEGHISLGLSTVISDLEELGYKVSWGIFSASEVGAPHQRKRVFILAYRNGGRWGQLHQSFGSISQPNEGCGQWPSRPGDVGDTKDKDGTESRLPLRQGQGESGGAGGCGGTWSIWPSRPGEQQFAWEPPRVVGTETMGNATGKRSRTFGAEPAGQQRKTSVASAGVAMGNAEGERPRKKRRLQSESPIRPAGDGKTMGNAAQRENNGREPRDMEGEAGKGRCGDHAADGAGENGGLSYSLKCRSDGWTNGISGWIGEPSEDEATDGRRDECETQPPLGRDADGPAGGMGYAELCVTCDNRTDELRLLGNGVVPATAQRAWETLISQINTES